MKRLIALLLMLLVLPLGCHAEPDGGMTLLAINVGKADCLLLTSGSTRYLIDTGTKASWGTVSAVLMSEGIEHLNGVIVTHTDNDHAGGAWALASSSVEVDAWYASAYFADVKASKHPVVNAAALRGEDVHWLRAGDTLALEGGSMTVLGPTTMDADKENNNSLVIRAETADGAMLLAGDMEFPEEELLLSAGLIAPAQVLKVGHHAEGDATSEALVEAVQPQVAVISTNSVEEPDTPDPRVMSLLRAAGAQVAITEYTKAGVLVTLSGGQAKVDLMNWGEFPPTVNGVTLGDKSVAQDTVCVHNGSDEAVDLSGWFIYSERGGETFVFPKGTVLEAGKSLSVSSLSSESAGDLVWQDTKVWHQTKDDAAHLYDAWGREMDSLE